MRMLILGIMLITAAACQAAEKAPVLTPDSAVVKFDDYAGYQIGYAYRGQKEVLFPLGWSGHFEENTGVACHPDGEYEGRKAFLLHCAWRNGVGIAFQEFTFQLPKAARITLRRAAAMRPDAVGKSDGVTFRVYADGRKLLDESRTDSAWKPFSFDLTSYAGKTVIIRFETDPGLNNDSSFDFSIWGDRELVLEDYKPKPIVHPDPPALNLAKMLPTPTGGVVPKSGFDGSSTVEMRDGKAIFRYSGPDGVLEYTWQRPEPGSSDPLFGRIELNAQAKGDEVYTVELANSARMDWVQPARCVGSQWLRGPAGSITCMQTFKVGDTSAALQVTGRLVGKSLVLEVSCDKPVVKKFDAGDWTAVMRRIQMTVPYYAGRVSYLPSENLFVNAFLDWTDSNATLQEDTRANYEALTDGSRNTLKETVVYTAAWHLAETLPNIPNPPSPYLKQVGGRIVLDIWGGTFTEIAAKLEELHSYGISDCIAIIHNWQRSGYDNALPMHYPANPDLGGDNEMKTLVSTAKRLGYLIALHENYVDYYPNYDLFDPNDIPLHSDGKRVEAWYNPGTRIQSFAVKPNAILRLAKTQSPEIHSRYGTNANYLDVHSCVPPWFHADSRAGEKDAGMFKQVWDAHRQLWQFERETHGGPVFGEGNNHWYWSGYLDGVEAQFGTGWGHQQGLSAPLAVDFDLMKIHPLQFNHGMGYYERWWSKPQWGRVPPMVVLDQYRMQEVAYGHAGFLGSVTWSVAPLAWLEHHLLTPVTERYANAKPKSISYEVNGKWVDGTAAAKAGEWNRVRVVYSNGLAVTANNCDERMQVGNFVLPRFGWIAQGAGVTAYTALKGGALVDYAETKDSVFANARNLRDWDITGPRRIRPEVAGFKQTDPRAFSISYRWIVNDTLKRDYHCFVHFSAQSATAGDERIKFQQDHPLKVSTSQWKPGQTIEDGPYTIRVPDDITDGNYGVYIGFYTPGEGRLALEGYDDGEGRIRLGTLSISDGGKNIVFEADKSKVDGQRAIYLKHLNQLDHPVDFGSVRTDGSVLVRREGDSWVLRTYPRDRDMIVELNAKRFPAPGIIECTGGGKASTTPERKGEWWRLPIIGASEYRWKAE